MAQRGQKFIAMIVLFGGLLSVWAVNAYADRFYGEYYHTKERYACMIEGRPSAFGLAQNIARGTNDAYAKYNVILESYSFDEKIEAPDLAYALYLISERIGDRRAVEKKEWLERYIDHETVDKIASTVYLKYSKEYLENCFSIDGRVPVLSVNEIYPIYMDQ